MHYSLGVHKSRGSMIRDLYSRINVDNFVFSLILYSLINRDPHNRSSTSNNETILPHTTSWLFADIPLAKYVSSLSHSWHVVSIYFGSRAQKITPT